MEVALLGDRVTQVSVHNFRAMALHQVLESSNLAGRDDNVAESTSLERHLPGLETQRVNGVVDLSNSLLVGGRDTENLVAIVVNLVAGVDGSGRSCSSEAENGSSLHVYRVDQPFQKQENQKVHKNCNENKTLEAQDKRKRACAFVSILRIVDLPYQASIIC